MDGPYRSVEICTLILGVKQVPTSKKGGNAVDANPSRKRMRQAGAVAGERYSVPEKTGSARELIGSTAAGYVIDQSHGKLDGPNTSCALPIELEP